MIRLGEVGRPEVSARRTAQGQTHTASLLIDEA